MSPLTDEQLAPGEFYEEVLDPFFRGRGVKVDSPAWVQKYGADRVFRCDKQVGETKFLVEYKTDRLCAETGNVYVETISADTMRAPGWARHSFAQLLVVYVPQTGKIYVANMYSLKRKLDQWEEDYETKPTRVELNDGYRTWGICVPLEAFMEVVVATYSTEPRLAL